MPTGTAAASAIPLTTSAKPIPARVRTTNNQFVSPRRPELVTSRPLISGARRSQILKSLSVLIEIKWFEVLVGAAFAIQETSFQ